MADECISSQLTNVGLGNMRLGQLVLRAARIRSIILFDGIEALKRFGAKRQEGKIRR
jgi:hypothetical protein